MPESQIRGSLLLNSDLISTEKGPKNPQDIIVYSEG
jgi:hypothetical protein